MIRLDDIAVGDRWPFPQFRLYERKLVGSKIVVAEIDLATDFTNIKFSSRHEDNRDDVDDHTKDDIYSDTVFDGGGLLHYEWGATDTDTVGHHIGRLVGTRIDSKVWHSKFWFHYYVVEKSRYGRTTS